ncbi:hypothetical protein HB770_26915 (plasmid) [Rhizobium leguminosarum bv. viciae]|uniref:Uncharacterized protein n=1 Tax=Rhizobium leguminosarum bv. viciae TaxID=387 RepID=A0A7G6RMJ9_RHILV|nr:hypothetical protein HB770_26915 [Rhizobium leguminosarum bv. viciae]
MMVTYARYSIDQQNPVGGGIALNDKSLTTGKSARLGSGSYEDWLARQVSA